LSCNFIYFSLILVVEMSAMPHFSSPGHQQQQQKQLNHHQEADRDLPPPPPEPDISSSGATPLPPPTEKVVGLLNRAANVSAMQLFFL
jgi:hypothetical protein